MSARWRLQIFAALMVVAIAGTITAARAEEFYVCDDGKLLVIDNENRPALRDHPCVKAWRERNAARAGVEAPGAAPVDFEQPRHRRIVNLLRDATAPPGLLHLRTMYVRSYPGKDGAPVWADLRSPPQGYVPYVPAAGPLRPRVVYVRSYVRKDGTPVRAHFRSAPRRRR
jgi:hypothetical protein